MINYWGEPEENPSKTQLVAQIGNDRSGDAYFIFRVIRDFKVWIRAAESAMPQGRGTEAKQVESFGRRVDLRPSATDPAGSGMRRNRGRDGHNTPTLGC